MRQTETESFRDFLKQKLAEQHNPQRQQTRDEWIAAVGRLYDQVRAWVADLDPDGLLQIVQTDVRVWEPALGDYTIPMLEIFLGEARVEFEPRRRNLRGSIDVPGETRLPAAGLVTINCRKDRYELYRTSEDGRERWYVLDINDRGRLFDRERFEVTLRDLLG
jgi:hypothetical protein